MGGETSINHCHIQFHQVAPNIVFLLKFFKPNPRYSSLSEQGKVISLRGYLPKDSMYPPGFNAHFYYGFDCISHLLDYIIRDVQNVEGLKFLNGMKDFLEDKLLKGDPVKWATFKDIPLCSNDTIVERPQILGDFWDILQKWMVSAVQRSSQRRVRILRFKSIIVFRCWLWGAFDS